jgi:CubicO group peptidase (beta-lactamase class C family)
MGGGLHIQPRDFMKLGQVILDGGRWQGRQILSSEWAKRSIASLDELRGLRSWRERVRLEVRRDNRRFHRSVSGHQCGGKEPG